LCRKKKNHILIIVENLPVPFDRRVWREALALKVNGYDVSIICPKGYIFTKKIERINDIYIYRHPVPKEKESFIGYLKEYATALFWEWYLSFKLFIRKPFDVIHACNPPDNIFLIGLFFKVFGVKFIFDHHDLAPEAYLAKFGRKDIIYNLLMVLEKLTFKLADISIATNNSYKEIAIKRGNMGSNNIFVVRNGPELNKFNGIQEKKSLKYDKEFLVGYVGNMGKQEGIDLLLKVVHFITKKKGISNIHFTCVGGGPALNYLRNLAKTMKLTQYINFTGRIPDKELYEILKTSDVCVNPDIPSKLNDKSTMIKIMEYMAFKKPIVQFDLKEGRFSAQKASLYAKKGNTIDFGDKILTLLNNEDLRNKTGNFGYKRIRDKLDWKYSIPNLRKAYRTVLQ